MIKIKMNNEIIKNAGFARKGLKLLGKTFDATLRYPKTTILSGIYLFNDTVRESVNEVVLETVTGEEQTAQYTPPQYATEKRDEIIADISSKVNDFCVKFSNREDNLNFLLEYYSDGDSELKKVSEKFCKKLKEKLIVIGNRKKNSLNSLGPEFTEADKKFLRESINQHIAKIEECCNTELLEENLKDELDSDILAQQPELTESDSAPDRMTVEERLEELRRSREEQVSLNRGRLDRLREERENFEEIFKEKETKAPRISSDTVDFLRRVEDKMSPFLFRKYSKLFKKTMNQAGMKFDDKSLSATSKREVKILMAATSGMMSEEEYNPKLLILDYLRDELGGNFDSVYKAMEQEARQDMRNKSDDNYLKPNKLALFSKGFIKKTAMNHAGFETFTAKCFNKLEPSAGEGQTNNSEIIKQNVIDQAKGLLQTLEQNFQSTPSITNSKWLKAYCSKPESGFQTTPNFYSNLNKILSYFNDNPKPASDKVNLVAQFVLAFSGNAQYDEGAPNPSYSESSNWAKILNSLPDLVSDQSKIDQFEKNIKLAKEKITYDQYLGDDTQTPTDTTENNGGESSDTNAESGEQPEETYADSSISADFNYSIESVKAALDGVGQNGSIDQYKFKETYDNASKKGSVIADVTIKSTDNNNPSRIDKTLSNAFSFSAKSAEGKSVWLHYYVSNNYHLFPAGKISGGMKVFATNDPQIPTGKYNISSTKPRINYGVCYIANVQMTAGLESENRNILSMIRRFNWGGKNIESANNQLKEAVESTANATGFKPTISLIQANSIFREREGKRLTFKFNGTTHKVNAKKPAMIELDLTKKYKIKRRAIEDDGSVAPVKDIYKAFFSNAPNGHMYFSPAVAYALQQTDAAELQAYLKNIVWLRFIYSNPGLFPTRYNELLKQYRDNIVGIATKVINSLK